MTALFGSQDGVCVNVTRWSEETGLLLKIKHVLVAQYVSKKLLIEQIQREFVLAVIEGERQDIFEDNISLFTIYNTQYVMVIVVGNGHGDTSSNPGRGWLHFTYH